MLEPLGPDPTPSTWGWACPVLGAQSHAVQGLPLAPRQCLQWQCAAIGLAVPPARLAAGRHSTRRQRQSGASPRRWARLHPAAQTKGGASVWAEPALL